MEFAVSIVMIFLIVALVKSCVTIRLFEDRVESDFRKIQRLEKRVSDLKDQLKASS